MIESDCETVIARFKLIDPTGEYTKVQGIENDEGHYLVQWAFDCYDARAEFVSKVFDYVTYKPNHADKGFEDVLRISRTMHQWQNRYILLNDHICGFELMNAKGIKVSFTIDEDTQVLDLDMGSEDDFKNSLHALVAYVNEENKKTFEEYDAGYLFVQKLALSLRDKYITSGGAGLLRDGVTVTRVSKETE